MKLLEFNDREYTGEKIIVYGTTTWGKMVHYCLKKKDMKPAYFVNKEGRGIFYEVPVISIEKLAAIYQKEKLIILLAVGNASREVLFELKIRGIEIVYSISQLLDEIRDIGKYIDVNYYHRENFFFQQNSYINSNQLILNKLDVVVTEKCSLRCEKCSNLMQYYHNPRNYEISEIASDLNKVLSVVDCLHELRILGGEPFMNTQCSSLVDMYKNNSKIKRIRIYTNSTIFPDEENRKKLIDKKVMMVLSYYDELSKKIGQWVEWCEANEVEYVITKMNSWQDCGKLVKHYYSQEDIRYIYETCECKYLPTLLNGKIYNCPYAAHAVNLGAVLDEEASLDGLDIDDKDNLRNQLKSFLYGRDYLMSCDYCGGRNGGRAQVKPHEQIEKPLDYEVKSKGNIRVC